jgi:hypothetical protein
MMKAGAVRGLGLVAAVGLAVLGSGCATTKQMALSKAGAAPTVDGTQALAVATVRLANNYRTSYQPHLKRLLVKADGEKGETFSFDLGEPHQRSEVETDQYEEFLVSMALPPGQYELTYGWVQATGFLIIGSGTIPIYSPLRLEPSKAVYLGRLEVLRRERVGEEPRAGIVIPLIDQSVAGFSGGTFEVKLVDHYEEDLALLKAEFPALASLQVERQLLPPPRPEPVAPPAKE